MKHINLLFFLTAISLTFGISSCEPDNPQPSSGNPPPPTSQYYFRVTIDGQFYPGSAVADPGAVYSADDETYLLLGGDPATSLLYGLHVPEDVVLGQAYPFMEFDDYGGLFFQPDDSTFYFASESSGTYTITTLDTVNKIIGGTISPATLETYDGSETVSFGGGEFRMVYIE